ncbi:MAG: hypothetical protein HY898_24680, partial [Deltaproteobacteria bacterium]|nr:hypothetical protein [Deltaproteobacteria bacterium]
MNRHLRTVGSIAWIAVVLGAAHDAGAEVSAQDRAAARAMFDEGRALARDGKHAQACPKFEESNRIDPGIGAAFNLADCYENIGRTASAWSTFLETASMARTAGQPDREKIARDRAEALAPRLVRLMLSVPKSSDLAGLELKRDGTAVGKPMWGQPVPVDPGKHRVEASAPGHEPWATSVDASDAGKTITVEIPPLSKAAAGATPTASSTSPPPASGGTQRTVAVVAAGVGIVGLAAGSLFGLKARSKWNDAQGHCEGRLCDDAGVSMVSDAKSAATLSTLGFAVGLAGVAGATVLWL